MLEGGSNGGKFQHLAGFVGRSALVGTLESCSVLEYICLRLTVEFEVMGREFLGWFSRTFRRSFCRTNICIWPNVQLCILSRSLVHCVPCEVSLHRQTPRGFAVCVTASPNSSALWAGFCRCLCEHQPNSCESSTAVHPGSTSNVCISTQQCDNLLHRKPTRRLSIRAHTEYMTIGFGSKGYIPGGH